MGVNTKPLIFFFDENPSGLAAGGERLALVAPRIGPIIHDPGDGPAQGHLGVVHLGVHAAGVLQPRPDIAQLQFLAFSQSGIVFPEGGEIGVQIAAVFFRVTGLDSRPHGFQGGHQRMFFCFRGRVFTPAGSGQKKPGRPRQEMRDISCFHLFVRSIIFIGSTGAPFDLRRRTHSPPS